MDRERHWGKHPLGNKRQGSSHSPTWLTLTSAWVNTFGVETMWHRCWGEKPPPNTEKGHGLGTQTEASGGNTMSILFRDWSKFQNQNRKGNISYNCIAGPCKENKTAFENKFPLLSYRQKQRTWYMSPNDFVSSHPQALVPHWFCHSWSWDYPLKKTRISHTLSWTLC